MAAPKSRCRLPKQLDAECFQPEISSFRLHLAAEGKAAKTVRTYVEAVQWFASSHLVRETSRTRWEEVGKQDVQQWIVWLLERYSSAYASNQFRALQQFFKWLATEDEIPDPMAGLRPPHVPDQPVPVFKAMIWPGWSAPVRAVGSTAPRRRHDRSVPGDRDAPVGTRGHPLRPRRPRAQRP
jgi:hypothetical protein